MKYHIIYAIMALAFSGVFISCNEDGNPTGPSEVPGTVILSEGFETDLSSFRQVTYSGGWGIMSLSNNAAHTGTGSLTSDSNKTGVKEDFTAVTDSVVGLDFYLMAKKAEQINFYAALARTGSSWNGLFAILGMGISQSDSLFYVYEYEPTYAGNEHTNFAPLELNKWYNCRIEHDFTTSTLTYLLDGQAVRTITTPAMMSLSVFVTMRDELGLQGSKEYYIDDVNVYKR